MDKIENGTIQFKGRALPAGIIKANFKFINRIQGERKLEFIAFMGAYDQEFNVWRPRNIYYTNSGVNEAIEYWKKSNSFVSK